MLRHLWLQHKGATSVRSEGDNYFVARTHKASITAAGYLLDCVPTVVANKPDHLNATLPIYWSRCSAQAARSRSEANLTSVCFDPVGSRCHRVRQRRVFWCSLPSSRVGFLRYVERSCIAAGFSCSVFAAQLQTVSVATT